MTRGTDAEILRGHARPGDILIYIPSGRDTIRAEFTGAVVSRRDGGSELAGTIGPGWAHEGAYWFTMAIGSLFGLGGLVGATVEAVQAHPAKALPNLALVAGGLAWVFVWRGITSLQARTAETRVAFLEEWLRRQLTAR